KITGRHPACAINLNHRSILPRSLSSACLRWLLSSNNLFGNRMKHLGTIVAVSTLMLAVVSACATRPQPNGENYYVQATKEYNSHFYQPAIADYQKLIDEYPFSPYAEEAELNIGLSYYKQH